MWQALIEISALFGAGLWLVILVLPWRPWSTREYLETSEKSLISSHSSTLHKLEPDKVEKPNIQNLVTVLTPARNEEDTIETTVDSVLKQNAAVQMIVVNDQSSDATGDRLRDLLQRYPHNLTVIEGSPLSEGWSGKLWALQQGFEKVSRPYTLLLDADIRLKEGFIETLIQHAESSGYDLTSIMASLRMKTLWEKWLIPAFVYFFKLLYPFHLGNSPRSRLGVAAGGCILIKTDVLRHIGGFSTLKTALIDDCTLAQTVKSAGFRTWIGLSLSVTSHRGYENLTEIGAMISRSAFTQLKYSWVLLLLCSVLMISLFASPLVYLAVYESHRFIVLGVVAMVVTYAPILRFYNRSFLWLLTVPATGLYFLAMTWASALRYLRGHRSQWKGRVYLKNAEISHAGSEK